MAEVNLKVSADIQGIKTKLEELTKSVAEVQSKMGNSFKAAAETSEKAMVDASNTITTTMVNNTTKVISSLEKEEDQLKALQMMMKQSTNPDAQKSLQKEIDATNARIKSLGGSMQKFRDISVMSLGEMKKYMRELRGMSLVGMTPEQINKVNTQMALLKDKMADYSLMLSTTGDKTQMLIGAMQGFVGVAQGVTGTLSLMGIENKNLEKSMMALINLSQMMSTFHQLEESGILAKMGATIKDTVAKYANIYATKAQAMTQKAATASTQAGAVGFRVLGAAMKAVPIIALVAGIGALVYALTNLGHASEEARAAEERWKNLLKNNEALKENQKIYEDLKIAIRDLGLEYDVLTGKISANQAQDVKDIQSAEEEKKKIRGNFVSFQLEEEDATNKLIQAKRKEHNKALSHMQGASIEVMQTMERSLNDEILQIQTDSNKRVESKRKESWGLRKDVNEKYSKMEAIREKEEADKKLAAAQQAWEQYYSKLKSWMKRVEDLQDDMIVDDEDRELAKLKRARDRELSDLTSSGIALNERGKMEAVITKYYLEEEEKIRAKYAKSAAEKRKEAAKKLKDAAVDAVAGANDAILDAMIKEADEENKLWTLRSLNAQLSIQDRTKALLELEDIRYKEEQEKYKGNLDILEQLKQEHENNIKNINAQTDETEKSVWDKRIEIAAKVATKLYDVYKKSIDDQIKAYDDLINQREQRIGEIQSLLEAEIQLNKDGFASNIQMYQTQLEQEQKLRDSALAQQDKYNKRKAIMESFEQSMDISSAIASILADAGVKFGVAAPIVGGLAIAALLTLFKQQQAKGAVKFEHGGRGVFDGADHAHGGIPFGSNKEAQGGEAYYILNKSATNSKGRKLMDVLFDAVNGGRVNFDAPLALADTPISVEMKEQREIKEIWKHLKGQKSTVYGADYRIETFGNVKRKIKN